MNETNLLREWMTEVNVKLSLYRPLRPIGLRDVEAPIFSLDNRLTDGAKVVSLTRRPPFTPQENSWYSFLLVGMY
jgi:hypothetical protein